MGDGESFFRELLKKAVEVGATDIHLKSGLPPIVRRADELKLLSRKLPAMSAEQIHRIVQEIAPDRLLSEFKAGREIDLAYGVPGLGRFRMNLFMHRGQPALICRFIPFEVPSLDELGLPPIVKKIALQNQGLVLVTGPAGSGKSTTLAAMLSEWNTQRSGHIVTIEDPIEYLVRDKKSVITQREVGVDTETFATGLKHALRQDPDAIMIGEMRDLETIRTAMVAAETGHLVLSTLHSKTAMETVNRVIGVFDPAAQFGVRNQFASTLAAVVSQRLIPGLQKPLVLACEVLVNAGRVVDCLRDPSRTMELAQAIEEGTEHYGMQSLDQSLMHLLQTGQISQETALRHANVPADFLLKMKGISGGSQSWKPGEVKMEGTGMTPVLDLEDFRKKGG